MKRGLLNLILIFSILTKIQAQCTPDPAIDVVGGYLYPTTIPFATVNVPYSQVLTFKVPLDSVIILSGFQVRAHVDSAKIIWISGIPSGYGYQCNRAGCVWLGGTKGCVLLSGVGDSTKLGTYPMWIYVYTYASVFTLSGTFIQNQTRIDSSDYTFKVQPVGVFEVSRVKHLDAFPNPVNDVLHISLEGIDGMNSTVEVFDPTGRRVYQKEFNRPSYYAAEENVDMTSLPKGLYLVVLKNDQQAYLKKVLRN